MACRCAGGDAQQARHGAGRGFAHVDMRVGAIAGGEVEVGHDRRRQVAVQVETGGQRRFRQAVTYALYDLQVRSRALVGDGGAVQREVHRVRAQCRQVGRDFGAPGFKHRMLDRAAWVGRGAAQQFGAPLRLLRQHVLYARQFGGGVACGGKRGAAARPFARRELGKPGRKRREGIAFEPQAGNGQYGHAAGIKMQIARL